MRNRRPRNNPSFSLDRIDPASLALGVGVALIIAYVAWPSTTTPSAAPGGAVDGGGVGGGTGAKPQLGDGSVPDRTAPPPDVGAAPPAGSNPTSDLTERQRLEANLRGAEAEMNNAATSPSDRAAARDLVEKIRVKLGLPPLP